MLRFNFRHLISLQIFLLFSILNTTNAQKKLMFGVNPNIFEKSFQKILVDTTTNYKDFFKEFNIKFLRFPGGEPAKYFFWNNPKNSEFGFNEFMQYKISRGTKKRKFKIGKMPNQNIYEIFLKFCDKNDVIPIIQLNATYYENERQVYQIEKFRYDNKFEKLIKARYKIIDTDLKKQIDSTHQLVDSVFWEIGNENYYNQKPEDYLKIVQHYSQLIKSNYPNDKIIVELANSFWSRKSKEKWNKKFIYLISIDSIFNFVDYFAPHFYPDRRKVLKSEKDIFEKCEDSNPLQYYNYMINFFPKNLHPKFFYTEFGLFSPARTHPNYSTQLHALVMEYCLFYFYATPNLYGIIHHGFTQPGAPLFYPKRNKTNNDLKFNIPPEAKAISIFYKDVGEIFDTIYTTDNVVVLKTYNTIGGKKNIVIQILNISATQKTLNFSYIFDNGKLNFEIDSYEFDNLEAKKWQAQPKKLNFSNSSELIIPSYSYTSLK